MIKASKEYQIDWTEELSIVSLNMGLKLMNLLKSNLGDSEGELFVC